MSQNIQKLAVLFADISGSTALYDSLGDLEARSLIARCLTTMAAEIPRFHGSVIKTIGDEIMCTFPSAEGALLAASAMQQAVNKSNKGFLHPMHVRIGFHYGDVICEEGDVFGDTANVAAHVTKITRANQIMTTQIVIAILPVYLQTLARPVMRSEFKGKQNQFDIFLISWGDEDTERTRIGIPAYRKIEGNESENELSLRYYDQSCIVNKRNTTAILGREDICQITVRGDFASRQHVRIEFRLGKFFLVDQSTNGTYVRFKNGNVSCITRDEVMLEDTGSISLGQSFSMPTTDPIEFSISPAQALQNSV